MLLIVSKMSVKRHQMSVGGPIKRSVTIYTFLIKKSVCVCVYLFLKCLNF